jgi:hypothetical protein
MGSGGVDHAFLTSEVDGGEWSASRTGRAIPGEIGPGTHWTGGWISHETCLDDVTTTKSSTPAGHRTLILLQPSPYHSLYAD